MDPQEIVHFFTGYLFLGYHVSFTVKIVSYYIFVDNIVFAKAEAFAIISLGYNYKLVSIFLKIFV